MNRGMAVIAFALFFALVGTARVWAGVGGAAGPTWPATLSVGEPVSAFIDIFNVSDGANASENVDILQIMFTPSCAAQSVGSCTIPDVGVFTLASVAIGDPTSSCNNTIFTFVGPNAAGVYTLNPPAYGASGRAARMRVRICSRARSTQSLGRPAKASMRALPSALRT
jgi:hypothetical protein